MSGNEGGRQSAGPVARIMVATPTYSGELHHRYVESFTAALVHCLYHRVELEVRFVAGASLIQYARNQLVREFLEDESFTHLLWIDSDVGFDPRAVLKLLSHDKDIVGGVYPMKCIPIEWPYEPMPGEQSESLHRAKVLPNGFMLCTRQALQTLADGAQKYMHYMGGMKYETAHIFDAQPTATHARHTTGKRDRSRSEGGRGHWAKSIGPQTRSQSVTQLRERDRGGPGQRSGPLGRWRPNPLK